MASCAASSSARDPAQFATRVAVELAAARIRPVWEVASSKPALRRSQSSGFGFSFLERV